MCFQKVRIDNLDTIISHSTTMHFCTVPLYEDGICLNISYINSSKTKDDALSWRQECIYKTKLCISYNKASCPRIAGVQKCDNRSVFWTPDDLTGEKCSKEEFNVVFSCTELRLVHWAWTDIYRVWYPAAFYWSIGLHKVTRKMFKFIFQKPTND